VLDRSPKSWNRHGAITQGAQVDSGSALAAAHLDLLAWTPSSRLGKIPCCTGFADLDSIRSHCLLLTWTPAALWQPLAAVSAAALAAALAAVRAPRLWGLSCWVGSWTRYQSAEWTEFGLIFIELQRGLSTVLCVLLGHVILRSRNRAPLVNARFLLVWDVEQAADRELFLILLDRLCQRLGISLLDRVPW